MTKPRVLQAPRMALYQPHMLTQGLRALGYTATNMYFDMSPDAHWLSVEPDISLDLHPFATDHDGFTRELDFFAYAAENFDIFHLHSGYGFFAGQGIFSKTERDRLKNLEFLKSMGKKLIFHWWGCDIRTESVDGVKEFSACHNCAPSIRKACAESDKIEAAQAINELADAQLGCGDLVASYPQIEWFNNAIDTDYWDCVEPDQIPEKYQLPETRNVRVYHAFGNSGHRGDVKGSGYIRRAVDDLVAEGCKVELMFFDKLPNSDLKYYLSQADVVVDQLHAGWYGSAAVEALSCGKPTVGYMRDEVLEIAPHIPPLIPATIENIKDVLRELVSNADMRKSYGRKARNFATQHHDYRAVAKCLSEIYSR